MFRDPGTDAAGSVAGGGTAPAAARPATAASGAGRRRRTSFLRDLHVRPDWQADALCAQSDPEAFFPEQGASTAAAKKVCEQCPVSLECLAWAMDNNERYGVWGGLSERERNQLRRSGAPITRTPASPEPARDVPTELGTHPGSAPAEQPSGGQRQRSSRGLSDRIAALYAAGLSDGDIARECDCSTSNVSRWRRTRDLKPNHGAVA